MRWYNQQESGPWDAVAQITSAIMQRNQQRAQDKKDLQSTQSLFGLLQPSEVDTGTGMRSQVNFDPALQTVKGAGAPQRGLFDFGKIGQTPPIYSGQGLFSVGNPAGMVEQGNIDLSMRPTVRNADGSISTVRSMGANIDGKEVLLPTVSIDGRIMTDDEAVNNYRQTGQHLGIFSSPESSTKYADSLHNQQAVMYGNGPTLQQPTPFNGSTALQQPTQQIQSPTITQKTRTIKDVENDIRKNYATRMQDAIKSGNINPTMLRQYMPQIQQQMNSEIEQARGDYKKSQGDAALQDVMNAKGSADQKKALIKYAQTTGNMDMATLRGLLSSNTQKYDDGANIHFYRTDSVGNPVDVDQEGKPVPFYSIDKKVSPELLANQKFQAEQNDLNRAVTIRGQDMTAARTNSGGSGGSSRYVNTPLGAMTTDQLLDTYTKAKGGRIKQTDQYGNESYKEVPPNQEILNILGPIIQAASGGGSYQQQQSVDPRVAQARALGYSDAEIQAFLNGTPQSSPAPVAATAPTDYIPEYMPAYPDYSGTTQPSLPSLPSINLTTPTFGSNNETLLDYGRNATWLNDIRNYVGNKYGR